MSRLTSARKELLTSMMKEAIYEAAVGVLFQHGVEGMTMDRVAAAAGMGKGSLYNYFQGKQDLLQFVHAKAVAPIHKAVDELVDAHLPAITKLEAILRVVFEHLASHHVFHLLLKDDDARMLLEPTQRTNREIAIDHFVAVFRQGIGEGTFRPFDPTQLAQMFVGALRELWDRSLAASEHLQPEPLIQPLLGVFLDGIRLPPGPQATGEG